MKGIFVDLVVMGMVVWVIHREPVERVMEWVAWLFIAPVHLVLNRVRIGVWDVRSTDIVVREIMGRDP